MKYLRTILLLGLCAGCQPLFAEDDHSLISPDVENYIGYGVIFAMLVLFIIAMLVILRSVRVLTRIILKYEGYTNEEIAAELHPAKPGRKKNPKTRFC
jgi:cytochrome c oxidase cbb3-type subunit 3